MRQFDRLSTDCITGLLDVLEAVERPSLFDRIVIPYTAHRAYVHSLFEAGLEFLARRKWELQRANGELLVQEDMLIQMLERALPIIAHRGGPASRLLRKG